MDTSQSLEQQLFIWRDWVEQGPASFVFHDCKLKVPIGSFPAGSLFKVIFMNYEDASIQMETNEGEVYRGHLTIRVRDLQPFQVPDDY